MKSRSNDSSKASWYDRVVPSVDNASWCPPLDSTVIARSAATSTWITGSARDAASRAQDPRIGLPNTSCREKARSPSRSWGKQVSPLLYGFDVLHAMLSIDAGRGIGSPKRQSLSFKCCRCVVNLLDGLVDLSISRTMSTVCSISTRHSLPSDGHTGRTSIAIVCQDASNSL